MDILFLGVVVFLFLLAVFHLSVGVSNDAVNFLTSAVGSRAASFKRIIIVAAVGILVGAVLSNGMMDVARHGMFHPENLSFYDVLAIFMAVMVTDIILLDIFNTLGMPTSTTVSLVFELLGATFVVALFKTAEPGNTLDVGDFLNTERALSVIIGIFLSVAIAFVFGTLVQFLARILFTFEYKSRLKWKAGLFGGVATTAIVYFILFKGIKDMSVVTPDFKAWLDAHTWLVVGGCLVIFTLVSQLLYACKVNVLKVVVLLGTFSLAMAFAGNDLVNFIGVPLTSLDSFNDFAANGAGDAKGFMMNSLNGSADTPLYFLVGAGMIMVVSLATSKKARQVTKTTVGLSSQSQGDEMFGSSRLGRSLVRVSLNACNQAKAHTPERVKRWISKRMDTSKMELEDGAAFDLVRGAVNLMVASVLIALGTSLKLPLSTTFVTFMVAMGTSLADKAWGRESAVFRITGVISVIGGWFITAGVAFIGAGAVVSLMHLGGMPLMIAGGVVAIIVLIRSNIRFRKKNKELTSDTLFQTILNTEDADEVWPLFRVYVNEKQKMFLGFAATVYQDIAEGFINDNLKQLSSADRELAKEKNVLKSQRRKLTLCMRKLPPEIAIEKNTWFHLSNNMAMSMTYNLRRIEEICKEHVENNFRPLPEQLRKSYGPLCMTVADAVLDSEKAIEKNRPEVIDSLRHRCDLIKQELTGAVRDVYEYLNSGDTADMAVVYVYLNALQESQEFVTSLRKMLRASGKLNLAPASYRSFSTMK